MDAKYMKRLLANLGLAGLIAGAGLSIPGCSSGGGGSEENPGDAQEEVQEQSGQSGLDDSSDAVGSEEEQGQSG